MLASETVEYNADLQGAVSAARFDAYRTHSKSDQHAWDLYRWNIQLSAAAWPLVADLEVALRNTIHDQLTSHFGRADWWRSSALVLDGTTSAMLAGIVQKHRRKLDKGTIGPGKIIADTTLGVWVNLLGKGGNSVLGASLDYEANLWRPALHLGFSKHTFNRKGRERRPTRADVHRQAELFQRLRNRIAHHEPIFLGIKRPGTSDIVPLTEVWRSSVELLAWTSPRLAEHLRTANQMPDLLTKRPNG